MPDARDFPDWCSSLYKYAGRDRAEWHDVQHAPVSAGLLAKAPCPAFRQPAWQPAYSMTDSRDLPDWCFSLYKCTRRDRAKRHNVQHAPAPTSVLTQSPSLAFRQPEW